MGLRIETSNPPLKQPELQMLEGNLAAELPLPYREFLLDHNGGVPYNNTFDVPSPHHPGRYLYSFAIRQFLGVNPKGHDDILRIRQTLIARLPIQYIPVAIDHFRNFMCLSLESGEVFFYDLQSALKSERPDAEGRIRPLPAHLYLHPVAPSFDEMLDRLYHTRFS